MLAAKKVLGKTYPLNEIVKILQSIYDEGATTSSEAKNALSKVKEKKSRLKPDPSANIIKSKSDQIKDFENTMPNISKLVDLRLFDSEE